MRDIETLTDKEVEDINKRLVFPSVEDGKKVFFDAISNCNYIDGKDYIDKVFDENSDLYVIEDEGYIIPFEMDFILEMPNVRYKEEKEVKDLDDVVRGILEEYFCQKTDELNQEILNQYDIDLFDLSNYWKLEYDYVDFYADVIEHISIEEVKESIYRAANGKMRRKIMQLNSIF